MSAQDRTNIDYVFDRAEQLETELTAANSALKLAQDSAAAANEALANAQIEAGHCAAANALSCRELDCEAYELDVFVAKMKKELTAANAELARLLDCCAAEAGSRSDEVVALRTEVARLTGQLKIARSNLGQCENLSEIRRDAFYEGKARAEKSESANAALREALTKISLPDCGCWPICRCNDDVTTLRIWKEGVIEDARAALAKEVQP